MVKTFEEYVKEAKKQTDPSRNRDINAIDSSSNAAINLANDTYNKSIEDTTSAFEDEYQKNAVQKLINEKQIAERNANLGLTDSGLNRTQQTAVQLGYANQKGNIDIAKRKALDNLSSNLAAYVTEINNERESNKLSVNQYYDQQNNTIATTMYNSDVNAEGNKPKVAYGAGGTSTGGYIVSSPTGTLSRDYKGSLKDNGVSTVYSYNGDGSIKKVTYTDSNSGISVSFDGGINPYTGRMHDDLRAEDGSYDPSKAFDNGYQPNNIGGIRLVLEEKSGIKKHDVWQNVFKCDNKYYVWDGENNEYFEVEKVDLGNGEYRWEEK